MTFRSPPADAKRNSLGIGAWGPLATAAVVLCTVGCGELTCPEQFIDADGTCVRPEPLGSSEPQAEVELCDGIDNDRDEAADEDWPELGADCGEGGDTGECVAGIFVCSDDGSAVMCEGAVGPVAEICDGKDNDCDGLIDEAVLSIKEDVFDDHATVTAVSDGFVVTRVIADQIRVETYDSSGKRTGYHDAIDNPTQARTFLQSDSADTRVLIALGSYPLHVVEAYVDSDLVPIIVETQELHEDWYPHTILGVHEPPQHPRVLASSSRYIGYRDLDTFALSPIAESSLWGLAQAPTVAPKVQEFTMFAVAGPYLVWEQSDNVRAGFLLDDGSVSLDIDVGRGNSPAISTTSPGPGVVFLRDGELRLSELRGLDLECIEGGFCNERIPIKDLDGELAGPTGLAFDQATDSWLVAVGTQLVVVGRSENDAVVKQAHVSHALDEPLNRVDVAVSGGTAAIVQAAKYGESVLTFLGCF